MTCEYHKDDTSTQELSQKDRFAASILECLELLNAKDHQVPVFVKPDHLSAIARVETSSTFGDQKIINSVVEKYLPEIKTDGVSILLTGHEPCVFVSYPDEMDAMMGHCELHPFDSTVPSTDYRDSFGDMQTPYSEKESGLEVSPLFPKPQDAYQMTEKTEDVDKEEKELEAANKKLHKMSDYLTKVESFVAEGVQAAFSPIEGEEKTLSYGKISPMKYKWRKPLTLSQLKKTLRRNPDYYKT